MARTVSALRDDLWRLYGEALEAREHEIAYHVLAALVHAAERLRAVELLEEIEERARAQLEVLDRGDASHPHSTRSAERRGNPGIFAQLAATAAAARARIKAELVQEKRKRKGRPQAPF